MSSDLLEGQYIYVTRYSGPVSMGDDRAMWQVTLLGEYVTANRESVTALIDELEAAAALLKADRDG